MESEKVGLKLNIEKMKIMASGPITSWKIDGETVETVSDFIFLGSKITADILIESVPFVLQKVYKFCQKTFALSSFKFCQFLTFLIAFYKNIFFCGLLATFRKNILTLCKCIAMI